MVRIIGPDIEPRLDWIALTDAIAAGHRYPKADIRDSFLYRGKDTVLNRAAWIDGLGMAVKTATIFPGNSARGLSTIGGAMSLFDDSDGTLRAYVDFGLVTKWKTAGDSLLGARRLARPDSRRILIVGAGNVAASLRESYGTLFPRAEFRVWNRSSKRAEALAAEYDRTEMVGDLAEAVSESDIIACATMSTEPVIRGDWLRPGQHLDLIGAYRPDMREADDTALRRGRVFVDSRASTIDHIGELKDPIARGVISAGDVIADFYELGAFTRATDDITIFKNGGGAHLDLMTARYMLDTLGD